MKIKKAMLFLLAGIMLFSLMGCQRSTEKRQYFTVDTGDDVVLEVDKESDYKIKFDAPYLIIKDGQTYLEGSFIGANDYDNLKMIVSMDPNAKFIDKYEQDENGYYVFAAEDEAGEGLEYFAFIWIKKSNTCASFVSTRSEEEVLDALSAISFKLLPKAPGT